MVTTHPSNMICPINAPIQHKNIILHIFFNVIIDLINLIFKFLINVDDDGMFVKKYTKSEE